MAGSMRNAPQELTYRYIYAINWKCKGCININNLKWLSPDNNLVSIHCNGHVSQRGHVDSNTGKCFHKSNKSIFFCKTYVSFPDIICKIFIDIHKSNASHNYQITYLLLLQICRCSTYFLFLQFSVAKATLELQMSVHLSICPLQKPLSLSESCLPLLASAIYQSSCILHISH